MPMDVARQREVFEEIGRPVPVECDYDEFVNQKVGLLPHRGGCVWGLIDERNVLATDRFRLPSVSATGRSRSNDLRR